jgi:putative tryptophan/tyrosine transport system substrate-binding protein
VVIALVALGAAPLVVNAQQAGKLWRIGFLGDGFAATRAAESLEPFRQGLAELGYVPGRNVELEVRWTEGNRDRRNQLAAELVRLKVDVIVTHGVSAALAVKAATTTIPIVVAVSADFVGYGLVTSLARPDGNLTGMTDEVAELASKEVQMLKEILPKMQSLALMWEGAAPQAARGAEDAQVAADRMGLRVLPMLITSAEDIEQAFVSAAKLKADAVFIMHTPLTVSLRSRIAQFAIRNRLPLIAAPTQFADAGGLISYGMDSRKYFRHAAIYVDKILKGAKPADLPIEQPTKFELVINQKTAKALGVTVPQSVLVRADRVIE